MPTGTVDPERRGRIARAALEVVADAGVERMTHRKVAKVAEVPLGSMTYHFSSRDDLLRASVGEAMRTYREDLSSWEESLDSQSLAAALTELVSYRTGPRRIASVVEYELYVAALRRPELWELVLEWINVLPAILGRRATPDRAFTLAMAFDGLVAKSLIGGDPLSEDQVRVTFETICPAPS